jgi:hypothetical protein
VPISLLGIPGLSYNITAERMYHAVNTYWIDPRTGVPVDITEQISSTLTDPAGDGSLTVASANLKMAPSAQELLANLARNSASQISTLRTNGPLLGVVLGVILLIAALIPRRRRRRR